MFAEMVGALRLPARFSIEELRDAKVPAIMLKEVGNVSVDKLKRAGYTAAEMRKYGAFNAKELKDADVPLDELKVKRHSVPAHTPWRARVDYTRTPKVAPSFFPTCQSVSAHARCRTAASRGETSDRRSSRLSSSKRLASPQLTSGPPESNW